MSEEEQGSVSRGVKQGFGLLFGCIGGAVALVVAAVAAVVAWGAWAAWDVDRKAREVRASKARMAVMEEKMRILDEGTDKEIEALKKAEDPNYMTYHEKQSQLVERIPGESVKEFNARSAAAAQAQADYIRFKREADEKAVAAMKAQQKAEQEAAEAARQQAEEDAKRNELLERARKAREAVVE
jgi:hypothetical protein